MSPLKEMLQGQLASLLVKQQVTCLTKTQYKYTHTHLAAWLGIEKPQFYNNLHLLLTQCFTKYISTQSKKKIALLTSYIFI